MHLWRVLELYIPAPLPAPHKKVEPCINNFSGVSTFKKVGNRGTASLLEEESTALQRHIMKLQGNMNTATPS